MSGIVNCWKAHVTCVSVVFLDHFLDVSLLSESDPTESHALKQRLKISCPSQALGVTGPLEQNQLEAEENVDAKCARVHARAALTHVQYPRCKQEVCSSVGKYAHQWGSIIRGEVRWHSSSRH